MAELYKLVWREKKDIFLALICGTLSGLTAVALFAQSGFLISKAALMPPFYIILILTAFLKLFGVVKSASKYGERYISHRATFRILSDLRMRFFDRLEPIAAQLFTRYQSGDLLARITGDVDVLQNFFLRVVYPPLVCLLVFFATIVFTLFFSQWIALVLLIGYVLVAVVMPLFFLHRTPETTTRQQLTTDLTEFLYGYRDLKLHQQHEEKQTRLLQLAGSYAHQEKRERNALHKSQTITQAIALLIALIVVLLGAYLVATGSLEGLYLAMLILVVLTVFENATTLAHVPVHYNGAKAATTRLDMIAPETQEPATALTPAPDYTINVQALSYHYHEASRLALLPTNLTIAPREKIAIVGPSGSGKTTLFYLLTKTLHATAGDISFNDQSLYSVDEQSVWQQMSIQLQQNHFFSGTVRDNLRLAAPHATDDALRDALQQAQLAKTLDEGIAEKGANLSGGEKQRLAFARVLLKNGAIWLLDEPFTSLDARTEARLMDTLLTTGTQKTILLITHKLQHLHKMDRIVVMHEAQVVEVGSFDILMQQKGLFYAMWQTEQRKRM